MKVKIHVLAYLFSIHFSFGAITALNALGLKYFYFQPQTVSITLIAPDLDTEIWVFSAVAIAILLTWFAKDAKKPSTALWALAILGLALYLQLLTSTGSAFAVYPLFLTLTMAFLVFAVGLIGPRSGIPFVRPMVIFLASLIIAVQASAGAYYLLRAFALGNQYGSMDANIELQASFSAYSLTPWLLAAFLFSWLWIPLLQKVPWITAFLGGRNLSTHENPPSLESKAANKFDRIFALLDPRIVLAVAVAIFVGYYPYFHNPPWLVGTDSYWRYYDPLLRMNSKSGFNVILQVLKERHPLALILLYAGQVIVATTPFNMVRIAPTVVLLLLGFSTWAYLGRRGNMSWGLIAFLMACLSITTAIAMYTSILANWIALFAWTAFFGYVAIVDENGKFGILNYLVLLGLSTFILIIHPWTWGLFAASIILYVLTSLVRRGGEARSALILASIVLVDLAFALLSITVLSSSQGWRVQGALNLYTAVLKNPSSVLQFWEQLNFLTRIWAQFFSPVYIIVCIVGVLNLARSSLSAKSRRLILSWLAVSGIGAVLAAPIVFHTPTDEPQLWRVLFDAPFYVAAPLGVDFLTRLPYRFRSVGGGQGGRPSIVPICAGLLVAGTLLALSSVPARYVVLLLLVPVLAGMGLWINRKDHSDLLRAVILLVLVLMAFDYTTRSLSLLLLAPHAYRP